MKKIIRIFIDSHCSLIELLIVSIMVLTYAGTGVFYASLNANLFPANSLSLERSAVSNFH